MALIYYWVFTTIGLAKKAAAEAGGARVEPTQFVVGDGNGAYHDPDPAQVALVHEVWRGAVNRVYVHPLDATLVVVEALIPEEDGGFDIREAGIVDADGDLIAVGKYPLMTKPAPGSGGARQEYVRGGMRISNGGDLVLQIDPGLVMATQEYVDQRVLRVGRLLGYLEFATNAPKGAGHAMQILEGVSPSIDQGEEIFSFVAARTDAAKAIRVRGCIYAFSSVPGYEAIISVWAGNAGLCDVAAPPAVANQKFGTPLVFERILPPEVIIGQTFSVRVGDSGGNAIYINSKPGSRLGGGIVSYIHVEEMIW